eukprot:TRINITY_DN6084_c1_g2_i8.p1 TRINITY_DN6084_c1_g2~~TRINITY_DN6084_c1_g2_i8.p1  ORF type:complete len:514 (+),score=102.09 TRINITY_DN6084_c1_g2_i8:475-2016(+)
MIGDVDLDASCLLFDKWGRWVETIFWDNLETKGVEHKGDTVLVGADDDDEVEDGDEAKNNVPEEQDVKEAIRVDLAELDSDVSTLVFAMNVFSKDKTFASLSSVMLNLYREIPGGREPLYKYKISQAELKDMAHNALIVGKIFKDISKGSTTVPSAHKVKESQKGWLRKYSKVPPSTVQSGPPVEQTHEWMVKALSKDSATTIPISATIDDVIPLLFSKKLVTPLVPTWREVQISLLSARQLASRDLNGKSDPYVIITCGEGDNTVMIRSHHVRNTLDPFWDEPHSIHYADDRNIISFDLYDHDTIGKDEYLGHFSVDISQIPPNTLINRWFRLQPRPQTPKKSHHPNTNARNSTTVPMKGTKLLENKSGTMPITTNPPLTTPRNMNSSGWSWGFGPNKSSPRITPKISGSVNLKLFKVVDIPNHPTSREEKIGLGKVGQGDDREGLDDTYEGLDHTETCGGGGGSVGCWENPNERVNGKGKEKDKRGKGKGKEKPILSESNKTEGSTKFNRL